MTKKEAGRPAPEKKEPESFSELVNATFRPQIRINTGEPVAARVISITKEALFLDLGTRAEGMISRLEFTLDGKLTVQEGDTVQVQVSGCKNGVFACTRHLGTQERGESLSAKDSAALAVLHDAFMAGIPVRGKVKAVNKGGFDVHLMGQRAFCPISQMEKNYCQDPQIHVDQEYDFAIMQFEEEGKNIVISRRELLVAAAQEKARARWQELDLGQVHPGVVTAVHDYGAFVDIGEVEGLLHVSEVSHSRIASAGEALQVGQRLNVTIIQLDREKKKISLSVKAQLADPWQEAAAKLAVGGEFAGRVVRLRPFGAFVELFPGVVGLLHVSQLGSDRRVRHPKEMLAVGDEVRVRILALDAEKKTVSLTMEEAPQDCSDELSRLKRKQEDELKPGSGTLAAGLDAALKGGKAPAKGA